MKIPITAAAAELCAGSPFAVAMLFSGAGPTTESDLTEKYEPDPVDTVVS